MRKLLIATNNKGKIIELQELLADLAVELITPNMLGLNINVVEDGESYRENAALKAIAFAKASGMLSMGDDSGLEVDALGGAPGLYSARYLPLANATDADRRAFLLQNLKPHARPWKAHFHASIAVSTADGAVRFADGQCNGEIIPEERGTNGFGYDPIFLMDGLGRTMAELDMEEKNHLSHRARAIQNAKPILVELLNK